MRPIRPSRGVPVALASLLVVAGTAPVAHAGRGVPVGGPIDEVVAGSDDGRALLLGRRGQLSAATLAPSGATSASIAVGRAEDEPPLIGRGADGSVAIAAGAVGNTRLNLAVRPAGAATDAPYGPFTAFTPGNDGIDASTVATLGGVVLAGSETETGGGGMPAVLRRAADGKILPPVVLPTVPGPGPSENTVQVGVDAAGRGIASWTTGSGAGYHVAVATIAADGTVGPVVALPGRSPSNRYGDVRLRVAPDGTGAIVWADGTKTSVAPLSTATGVDLSAPVSVPLRGDVAVQADGAAVVANVVRVKGGHELVVASRAAGKPFTAPTSVPGVDKGRTAVALSDGGWVATQEPDFGIGAVAGGTAVHGTAGDRPAPTVRLPLASATNVELRPAAPGGAPIVLAQEQRVVYPRGSHLAPQAPTQVIRLADGAPRPAAARISMARSQTLGRAGAVRMMLGCSAACSYRVVSGVVQDGRRNAQFDTARRTTKGTHRVSISFPGVSETETSPSHRLRSAKRVRFTIAVDDARGGQTVFRRRVTVRP
jgi:hypothetical protein